MRLALAAAVDAGAVAVLGFLAFRLGVWSARCGEHMDSCAVLNPLIVLLLLAALALYFGVSHRLWRSTPGRRLLRAGSWSRDAEG